MNFLKYLYKKLYVQQLLISIAAFFILLLLVDSFIMPWYVGQRSTHQIPSVIGLKKEDAVQLLKREGLEPVEGETRLDKKIKEGYVAGQNPAQGQTVKEGRRVYLIVSGGEQSVPVPSLRGRTLRDTKFSLERAGLVLGSVTTETSVEFPEGTVISQNIPPGVRYRKGWAVSISLSAGMSADSIVVPSLLGKTLKEAEKSLSENGLRVGSIIYQVSQELLPNTIIDQSPQAGEITSFNKGITLSVARSTDPDKTRRDNER